MQENENISDFLTQLSTTTDEKMKKQLRAYLFKNFNSLSRQDKDYIKEHNSYLFNQLVTAVRANLSKYLIDKEIIYPAPIFSKNDEKEFGDYFSIVLKKNDIEQLDYYYINNRNFVFSFLDKNNSVSDKIAKHLIENQNLDYLLLSLHWAGDEQYVSENAKKYAYLIDELSLRAVKNIPVLNKLFDKAFNLEQLMAITEHAQYRKIYKSIVENEYLLNYLLDYDKDTLQLLMKYKEPEDYNLIGFKNVYALDILLKKIPEFFLNNDYYQKKFGYLEKINFFDNAFYLGDEHILDCFIPIMDSLDNEKNKKMNYYVFHKFLQTEEESYIQLVSPVYLHTFLEENKKLVEGFMKNKTNHFCILDKYLLAATINTQDSSKKIHKI